MPPPPPKTASLPRKSSPSVPATANARVRARRYPINGGTNAIDTSLSAHPRTDPIKALNTLLRLLSSLPSRIGGCQYKLTPAEHTLSLHLVSILDPFVYHGVRALAPNQVNSATSAPLTGLVQQPTEILDAILFHVDSKKDLLSVGLACKRLHDVVFPRHFDYRVIRCKVSSISVWNHLIHHKSLARNVRKVEIIDERTSMGRVTASSSNVIANVGQGMLIPRGMLQGDTDLESTDDELTMHAKQERYLSAALLRMTGLKEFKWSCNHSPISIANVWPTLMMRAGGLRTMDICDNLVFAPKVGDVDENGSESEEGDEDESDNEGPQPVKHTRGILTLRPPSNLLEMTHVVFRSTAHSYGAAKQPELTRISSMLHQCINLKNLEIIYIAPRSQSAGGQQGTPSRTRPLADEFLMYSRWSSLTSLTLTNLRCASPVTSTAFLAAHPCLEVLHFDIIVHNGGFANPGCIPDGSLPRLREIKASKEVINAVLECPSDTRRPLEVIKGFKLSGHSVNSGSLNASSSRGVPDALFLSNIKTHAASIRKVELAGWHDMEDIRKITPCIPNVQHLDIGKRLGAVAQRNANAQERAGNSGSTSSGPSMNIIEWTELLTTLPELATMHGVKFFYEVASAPIGSTSAHTVLSALTSDSTPGQGSNLNTGVGQSSSSPSMHVKATPPAQMSMMERSRMRKNDEIASVLAWKCKKLRRVDHWEENGNKIIVLLRDNGLGDEAGGKDKVRWEVRRVKP